jgi:hypothetical protein
MTPEQVRQYAHREPFQPFRIRLHDGRAYDIRHPNLGLVGESVLVVGIPAPNDPNPVYYDRTVWLPLAQIDGIEPLAEPAVPGVS